MYATLWTRFKMKICGTVGHGYLEIRHDESKRTEISRTIERWLRHGSIMEAGVGFISAIVILYMSEIVPKKFRGSLVAGYQSCITISISHSQLRCLRYSRPWWYRIIPDSNCCAVCVGHYPRHWLVLPARITSFLRQERSTQKAVRALSNVRGQPADSAYFQDELAEIIANHEYEQQLIPQTTYLGSRRTALRDLFSSATAISVELRSEFLCKWCNS